MKKKTKWIIFGSLVGGILFLGAGFIFDPSLWWLSILGGVTFGGLLADMGLKHTMR